LLTTATTSAGSSATQLAAPSIVAGAGAERVSCGVASPALAFLTTYILPGQVAGAGRVIVALVVPVYATA